VSICRGSSTGGVGQQIEVEAIGVSDGQSVCGARVDFELAAGYEGGGPASGKFERGGGIAVALNNESGEGNGAQVGAKVGGGKHAVKLQQDLHGALQKHVAPPQHHLGGNRIFRRAEKGGSGGSDDVGTIFAEGFTDFLQSCGVDAVGICPAFSRSSE